MLEKEFKARPIQRIGGAEDETRLVLRLGR